MSTDLSELSQYEKIRNQIIAERKEQWQKLLEAKKDFDLEAGKKEKKVKKPSFVQKVQVRRSSRNISTVSYKDDNTGMVPKHLSVQF